MNPGEVVVPFTETAGYLAFLFLTSLASGVFFLIVREHVRTILEGMTHRPSLSLWISRVLPFLTFLYASWDIWFPLWRLVRVWVE